MTPWTTADLQAITDAANLRDSDRDTAAANLRQHFAARGDLTLALACQAADDLAAGRTIEAGNGLILTRDAPDNTTGHAIRDAG